LYGFNYLQYTRIVQQGQGLTRGWEMKIEVNLYATLSQYVPGGNKGPTQIVDVEDGTTVSDLLGQLGVPIQSAKLIFVDGTHADLDAVLEEGNRLGVFPPVGGG
jgi:sulfur carrier protein ThiS